MSLNLVATISGNIIGYGATFPIYNSSETFHFTIWVEKNYRQRGVGKKLYEKLLDYAETQGANRVELNVPEKDEESLNWANRRGFLVEHHSFFSTLQLQNWKSDVFQIDLERIRAMGIRMSSLGAEMAGEDTLRHFYEFYLPIHRDMPGMAGIPYPPYERWRDKFTNASGYDPYGYILAVDEDKWVGYSIITRTPKGWLNAFTGVDRSYRGRGLTLPIKVEAIKYARTQGANSVYTFNHSHNVAIVKVNQKLGYIPKPGMYKIYKEF